MILTYGINLFVSDGPAYGGFIAKHFADAATFITDLSTHFHVFTPQHEAIKAAKERLQTSEYRRAIIVVSYGPLSLPKAWECFPASIKSIWQVKCGEGLLATLTELRPNTKRQVQFQGKRLRTSMIWEEAVPPEPLASPNNPNPVPATRDPLAPIGRDMHALFAAERKPANA